MPRSKRPSPTNPDLANPVLFALSCYPTKVPSGWTSGVGTVPSTLCVVKVNSGKVIELGLYLQEHFVGCDATEMGVFEATRDLHAKRS